MSSKPSVLMVVPQYPYPIVGGLEKQSHELAKALIAQDVAVQVLSGKIFQDQADMEVVEGVPVFRLAWPTAKFARFLLVPASLARMFWRLRRSFDVVHLHQHSWVGLFVIVVAKVLGKPILTKLPNVGDLGLPGMRRQSFGWLRLAILLQSDAIVAMSAESLRELMNFGYPRERVLLTPNGIPLSVPPAPKQSGASDVVACRVVFLGRLIEQKQVDLLLRAWARVCTEGALGSTLSICGDGPLASALKQQCDDLGIAGNVVFAGEVEGAKDRLAEMDIFVLPSQAEGNSNAILEAMMAGLPIVSTPVGGTPMLLGDVGRAFLFPVDGAHQLSALLLSLIENRRLRIAQGLAMRHRVEQNFDIMHVAKTYVQCYGFLGTRQRVRVCEVSNPAVLDGQ